MNKNIFKYLRKKILDISIIAFENDGDIRHYKIESLGFIGEISFPSNFPPEFEVEGLLIDKLVENSDFMKRLEQMENRKENLKSLLD